MVYIEYLNNIKERDRKNSGGQNDTAKKPIVGEVVVNQKFRD